MNRVDQSTKKYFSIIYFNKCTATKTKDIQLSSRCGPNNDYIEGVDDIVPRPVIDFTENLNGDLFIEILTDINFAMLNGRIGVNDCTYISPWGDKLWIISVYRMNNLNIFKILV
jgi:hypothetical protein